MGALPQPLDNKTGYPQILVRKNDTNDFIRLLLVQHE